MIKDPIKLQGIEDDEAKMQNVSEMSISSTMEQDKIGKEMINTDKIEGTV